jgi:hypothetical protein
MTCWKEDVLVSRGTNLLQAWLAATGTAS